MDYKTSTIVRILIKVVLTVVLCVWLASFASGFAPIIANDIALGQLENSDVNFALMQAWNQLQNRVHTTQGLLALFCGVAVFYDIANYYYVRKGN